MRVTLTHALLLAALLLTLTLAADTAAATGVGTRIDCYLSSGGGIEICL